MEVTLVSESFRLGRGGWGTGFAGSERRDVSLRFIDVVRSGLGVVDADDNVLLGAGGAGGGFRLDDVDVSDFGRSSNAPERTL